MIDDLVDVLAIARITRLVTDDRVPFGWLRGRVKKAAWERSEGTSKSEEPYVVELLECPWCASVWVALAVLLLRHVPGWRYLARVLAASEVAGIIATYVER